MAVALRPLVSLIWKTMFLQLKSHVEMSPNMKNRETVSKQPARQGKMPL